MAIKLLLLLLMSSQLWAKVEKVKPVSEHKSVNVFKNFSQLSEGILKSSSPDQSTLHEYHRDLEILVELEYREGEVDRINEKVENHLKNLEGLKFHKSGFLFADYSSWQESVSLQTPGGKKSLIVTNQGECLGGGYGIQNSRYHFFADGCVLYGRGDIASSGSGASYHQSNVYGWGAKVSPAASWFVSSAGAELGLKIPFLYFDQNFASPNQGSYPGFHVKTPAKFKTFATVFTRWPFGQWFVQTEFGRALSADLTLWSIGGGYKF